MARYRLTIAYDGTEFHGWQRQDAPRNSPGHTPRNAPGAPAHGAGDADEECDPPAPTQPLQTEPERAGLRTVQLAVEAAVREAVREPVIVIGASRTDSGVHARHQTAAFTAGEGRRGPPDERMAQAINARLPPDVLIRSCVRTRDDFDPITDCLAKGYRYAIHNARDRPLWDRRYVRHIWSPLDERAMDEAARLLVGTHDFAAFAAAGHGRESTVRTVLSCAVVRPAPHRVHIDVSADGFLWNMVRIIAGTLVEVGLRRKTPADVAAALESRDRNRAGPTLRPEGLCLMWGRYPEDAEPGSAQGHAP